jgi:hypothetical protein
LFVIFVLILQKKNIDNEMAVEVVIDDAPVDENGDEGNSPPVLSPA